MTLFVEKRDVLGALVPLFTVLPGPHLVVNHAPEHFDVQPLLFENPSSRQIHS